MKKEENLNTCFHYLLGGPYSSFAGHDASRALAMFQTDLVKEEYDDLSDLDSAQMESVREWGEQLAGKNDKHRPN